VTYGGDRFFLVDEMTDEIDCFWHQPERIGIKGQAKSR
jgi:hypothetical protein